MTGTLRVGDHPQIVVHTVLVGIGARHHGGPSRPTKGTIGVGPPKHHALGRQPVQVRGSSHRMTHTPQTVEAVLVAEDVQDIRP